VRPGTNPITPFAHFDPQQSNPRRDWVVPAQQVWSYSPSAYARIQTGRAPVLVVATSSVQSAS
jgi:hypothetical protein